MTIHNHPIPIRDRTPEVIGSYWQLLAEADDFGVWSDEPRTTQARWDAEHRERSTVAKWRNFIRHERVSMKRLTLGTVLGSFCLVVWTVAFWAVFG
jgi:hypothetical protein